jgi:hypothetical protein
VLWLDERRRDTGVMIVHHLIAISILLVSHLTCIHRTAFTESFLFDVCDVILEASKSFSCLEPLKERKIMHKIWKFLCALGFIAFMIVWHVCRLFWVPLKVIYPAICFMMTRQEEGETRSKVPFGFLIYLLEVFILAMTVYWSVVSEEIKFS